MHLGDVINIILDGGYMTIVDRVNYSMVSKVTQRFNSIEALMRYVSERPIEPMYRFKFWRGAIQRCLRVNFTQIHQGDPYEFYIMHAADTHQANCMSSGQLGEIMRDVGRTFPDHPLFSKTSPGEAILARILKAIVSSRPDVGYCQGMNFIVGGLLIAKLEELDVAMPDLDNPADHDMLLHTEADVFWTLHSIMGKNVDLNGVESVGDSGVLQMESIWKTGFPKMKLRVYQFDRLFKWNMPDLHRHCEEITLSSEVVVSQWFMTLFSYTIPLEFTYRFWDYIFVGSWPSIFKVTLALLDILKDRMMDMDLEGVGLMMRDWKIGKFDIPVPSPVYVLQRAELFAVSQETLMALQENYALEMIALTVHDKLTIDSSVHHSFHGGSMGIPKPGGQAWLRSFGDIPESVVQDMEQVHKELVDMEKQIDQDKASMQKKILAACEACEQCHESLNSAVRAEVKWLETTNEIKYQIKKCHMKAAALTIAAVEDNKDSILNDTAVNVVAPSEESELESQGSDNIEALLSSDSEHEDEIINIAEDDFEDDEEVESGEYAEEDTPSGSVGRDGRPRNRPRSEFLSSQSVSEESNYSSGTCSTGSDLSPSDSASGSDSCTGSASRTESSVSGIRSSSRSSSISTGKGSVESHESAQDLFYRLMMGKAAADDDGVGRGNGSMPMVQRKNSDISSDDSLESTSGRSDPKCDMYPAITLTIDDGDITMSPISTSTAELISIAESSPVTIAAGDEPSVATLTDPEQTHHLVRRSPALLDPTTAKTSGWMSTSVVEKMKHNPNRRRVAGASAGGGTWRGLVGTKTPSPISFAPSPSLSTPSAVSFTGPPSPSNRPSNVANNLLRARMVSGDLPVSGRSSSVGLSDRSVGSNVDSPLCTYDSTPSPLAGVSLAGESSTSPMLDISNGHASSIPSPPLVGLTDQPPQIVDDASIGPSVLDGDASTPCAAAKSISCNAGNMKSKDTSPGESGSESNERAGPSVDMTVTTTGNGTLTNDINVGGVAAAASTGRSSPKGFFRFSATLREGMDMFYRATGTASTTNTAPVVSISVDDSCNGVRRKISRGSKNVTHIPGDSQSKSRLHLSRRTMDTSKRYSRAEARRKAEWVKECQKLQKRVAKLNRALETAQSQLAAAKQSKHLAVEVDSETRMWKEKLCEQFQTFVQDSNRLRSQKLLYVAETYGM